MLHELVENGGLDKMIEESMDMAKNYPEHAKFLMSRQMGGMIVEFVTEFLPEHDLAIVQMKNDRPVGLIDTEDHDAVNDMVAHFFGLDTDRFEEEERRMNGDSPEVHDPELDDAIASFEAQFGTRDWDAEMAEALNEEE